MLRKPLLILLSAVLSGCAWTTIIDKDYETSIVKLRAPRLHLLSMGMGKQEVIKILGHPDQFNGVRRNGADLIEVWEYHRMKPVPGPDIVAERYALEFTNGQLSRYESAGAETQ